MVIRSYYVFNYWNSLFYYDELMLQELLQVIIITGLFAIISPYRS